ncbi:MAG: efflux RND transporter periplasmic adaptor subunit [Deltaproteobacteria bacterium]|nr:efflux RND transporter periplasmic adaptor subunit [Deltaproteobacteria bacterium]
MKKKVIIAAAVIIAVTGAYLFYFRNGGDSPGYRTEKAVKGNLDEAVTATGTLNPTVTILVGTQVSGTIRDIYADFNSKVKKGQLIARIDPAAFEAQAEQARANAMSAAANVEKAQASLTDAKRTLDRSLELFSKKLIARSELDAAQTSHDTGAASLNAAKAAVAQAGAAARLAETNLTYTRILSPVNGVVISRNVDVGQTVAASFQTPTLFTIAEDLTRMQIDTNVNEADIGRIRQRQEAEFTVDAYPEASFKGAVVQVRNAPIVIQNVVTYDVVVNVANPEMKLKPGMTANVSIITARKRGVIMAPNAVFRFKPAEKEAKAERGGPAVWILENKRPKRVAVTTGVSNGIYTEIISGVNEGQELIAESLMKQSKPASARAPRMF